MEGQQENFQKFFTNDENLQFGKVRAMFGIWFFFSVSRMVKYTGYGNAAGLLARRGLMLGGKGENAANYSDEEDTDTEEYVENAHKYVEDEITV